MLFDVATTKTKRRHTILKVFEITYTCINPTNGEKEKFWHCIYALNELEAANVLLHAGIPILHIERIKRVKAREKRDVLLWRVKDYAEADLFLFASSLRKVYSPKEDQKENESD